MRTSDIVAAAATRWPERTALVFGDRRWTFREFDASAARQAAALSRRGVKAGDLVGLLMPNRPEWLFSFYALSRIGAVAVPINPAYTAAEVTSIVDVVGLPAPVLHPPLPAPPRAGPALPRPAPPSRRARAARRPRQPRGAGRAPAHAGQPRPRCS